MLAGMARRSPRGAAALVRELLDAGKPMHDSGIWVEVEGGWMIHDFADYGPPFLAPVAQSNTGADLTSSRTEAARVAGKASAEARRSKNGSAQPERTVRTETPNASNASNDVRTESPNVPRTSPNDSFERSPNVARSELSGSSQDLPDPGSRSRSNDQNNPETCQDLGRASAERPERDVRTMAEKTLSNPGLFANKFGETRDWPELQPIFTAFEQTWGRDGKPKTSGDPRSLVILKLIAAGVAIERLVLAVSRSRFATYMVENQSYQTLTTILRDEAQVDKFCALTALPRKAGLSREPQAEGGDWKPTVEKRS
jgi:hypothetical protein